jgi:hypothetical protein
MINARVIQNPLGSRRLTGINVGHDADITDLLKRDDAGHYFKELQSKLN